MTQFLNVMQFADIRGDELKKKKRGLLSLHGIVSMLLLIVLLSALLDMLVLSNRYMSLHDTVKELARTMAVQGGSRDMKPEGYPNNSYDSVELGRLISRSMQAGGFNGSEYTVYVEYTNFEKGTDGTKDRSYRKPFLFMKDGALTVKETDEIDYLHGFSVTIEASYNWIFTKYLFGLPAAKLTASAPGISEWKYDYDNWESDK